MASKLYSPAQPHKFELLAGELCGRTQQTSVCGWQAFCKGLANISPLDGKLFVRDWQTSVPWMASLCPANFGK